MNGDLLDQGVAPHSVDILLSSGALNNALDTPALLAGLRELLSADAWLVIQELTREHNEISVSQSLMMENPRDLRDERRQLFVHTGQWLEWLAAQGGDLACGVVPPGSALDLLGYDVLLARCKTDRARLEPAELLAFVEARVPRYMLPAQLRVLERLPVTGNGKIDRKALTGFARQPQADLRHGVAQAPADELENALLALWREVLDNPSLGVEQDFFGAGGDSLLIAQLIARLRERLESARRHPFDRLLRWALSQPTPRGLAERLRSAPEEGRGPALAAARGVAPAQAGMSRAPLAEGAVALDPLVRLVPGEGVPRVLVHEGLGTLLPYRPLLRALGEGRPLLGLAVHDSDAYLAIPAEHLNACLGRRYAEALHGAGLREVDLLGYCSGGLVALETAKSLVQRGVRVRQLDIVSSYRIPYRVDDERLLLFSFAATLGLDTAALGFPRRNVSAMRCRRRSRRHRSAWAPRRWRGYRAWPISSPCAAACYRRPAVAPTPSASNATPLPAVLSLGACQPGRGAGALRRRAAAVRAGRRQPIGAALRRGPGDPMAGRRAWRVRHPRGARRALRLPGRSPGAILVETHARGGEPMSDVRSVVVAGSRFGQFYAAGVAADPRFVLRGILGQGSRRSRALAERLGVETWCEVEALPDDVRLACVAVGGAARGEQGPALAEALMARGIDVLIEHPLLPREWQDLLRSAERLGRRCLLNTFYPQLPAVARFIELGRQLHRRRGIRHLDAACGVQVGFATLDILAALLEGVGPWSLESPSNDLVGDARAVPGVGGSAVEPARAQRTGGRRRRAHDLVAARQPDHRSRHAEPAQPPWPVVVDACGGGTGRG